MFPNEKEMCSPIGEEEIYVFLSILLGRFLAEENM